MRVRVDPRRDSAYGTFRRWIMLRSVLVAALVVLLSLPSGSASADPDRERALAKLAEGARLVEAREYGRALTKYEEAYALVPSPKILFNFGIVYGGLGRSADACAAFMRFMREATDATPESRKQARREIDRLSKLVGLLRVTADVSSAAVIVDGRPVGMLPLADPIPLAPGPHEVRLQATGLSVEPRAVDVAAGVRHELRFEVLRSVASPPPSSTAAASAGASTVSARAGEVDDVAGGGAGWKTTAGVGLIAAGALAAVWGGVSLLRPDGGCRDLPAGGVCKTEPKSTAPAWALVGVGVAAGTAGGIVLFKSRDVQVTASVMSIAGTF